jgi:flavin-binding protein dodecin
MKRSRKATSIVSRGGGAAMTGRDGAIDFAAKTELLNNMPAANTDDHIYRVIELVGTSERSIEDAISSAIARADKTLRNLRWFEVIRTSGHIVDGAIRHYQVTLKVGFTMEGPH